MKKVNRICRQCGKEFEVEIYRINRGKGFFCSNSCTTTYRNLLNNPAKRDDVRLKLAVKCSHPTHGKSRTRLYRIWRGIKDRCLNSKHHTYKYYGQRGISVCYEWQTFEPFMNWALSHGYTDNLTIDRIDVNGNYTPENCRWLAQKEQSRNTRRSLIFNGKSLGEWAEILNIPYHNLYDRIHRGWSFTDAINKPIHKRKKAL